MDSIPGDAATEVTGPPQQQGFSPPAFPRAKTVGPSSSQITAELPEIKAAIAAAGAEAAGAQPAEPTPYAAHTQARTTMQAGAGEISKSRAAAVRNWVAAGSLAAALTVGAILLLFNGNDPQDPSPVSTSRKGSIAAPDMKQAAPNRALDAGLQPDQSSATRPRPAGKTRPKTRSRKAHPVRKPGPAGKATPRPKPTKEEIFPDPFEPEKKQDPPKPPPRKPPPVKPPPKKPKKIGEGTMQF